MIVTRLVHNGLPVVVVVVNWLMQKRWLPVVVIVVRMRLWWLLLQLLLVLKMWLQVVVVWWQLLQLLLVLGLPVIVVVAGLRMWLMLLLLLLLLLLLPMLLQRTSDRITDVVADRLTNESLQGRRINKGGGALRVVKLLRMRSRRWSCTWAHRRDRTRLRRNMLDCLRNIWKAVRDLGPLISGRQLSSQASEFLCHCAISRGGGRCPSGCSTTGLGFGRWKGAMLRKW